MFSYVLSFFFPRNIVADLLQFGAQSFRPYMHSEMLNSCNVRFFSIRMLIAYNLESRRLYEASTRTSVVNKKMKIMIVKQPTVQVGRSFIAEKQTVGKSCTQACFCCFDHLAM